jgi:hypothetical protein
VEKPVALRGRKDVLKILVHIIIIVIVTKHKKFTHHDNPAYSNGSVEERVSHERPGHGLVAS